MSEVLKKELEILRKELELLLKESKQHKITLPPRKIHRKKKNSKVPPTMLEPLYDQLPKEIVIHGTSELGKPYRFSNPQWPSLLGSYSMEEQAIHFKTLFEIRRKSSRGKYETPQETFDAMTFMYKSRYGPKQTGDLCRILNFMIHLRDYEWRDLE